MHETLTSKRMTHSELFLFIGKCLAMDGHAPLSDEVAASVSGGSVPWEDFVWMGSSHFVLPALWSAFDRNGIAPLLPLDLAEHMKEIHRLNAARNRRIIVQCRHISRLLAPAGIRPVFFKGAALLLTGLFRDPGDRMMEDIDLLLPEGDIPGALDLLAAEGYLIHAIEEGKDETYADHHHLRPIYHPDHVATLEIHRSPVHKEHGKVITAQDVLEAAQPCFHAEKVTGDQPLWVAAPHHARFLVFLHEMRTGRGYLSSSGTLKGAFDFYLLSKSCPPKMSGHQEDRLKSKFLRFAWGVERIMDISPADTKMEGVRPPASGSDGRGGVDSGSYDSSGTKLVKSYQCWWKIQLFLLDHPGIDTLWYGFIYAPASFILLLVRSIGVAADRQLVAGKIRRFLNFSSFSRD